MHTARAMPWRRLTVVVVVMVVWAAAPLVKRAAAPATMLGRSTTALARRGLPLGCLGARVYRALSALATTDGPLCRRASSPHP